MDVGSSIRSKHSDRSVLDRSIYTQSDGHFCFPIVTGNFSIQIYIYLLRSVFHLNWPVMDSDL